MQDNTILYVHEFDKNTYYIWLYTHLRLRMYVLSLDGRKAEGPYSLGIGAFGITHFDREFSLSFEIP